MSSTNRIQTALCPRIVVYAASSVDDFLQDAIHLPNLAVLLKPWQERGVERVSVRNSAFEATVFAHFPLRIDASLQISQRNPWELENAWLDTISTDIGKNVEQWTAETPLDSLSTPWYDRFLDSLLDLRFVSTQKTFDHPLMSILAVHASDPDPLNALATLYSATSAQEFMPNSPYVDPNILRYYVVLHDVKNGNLVETQQLLEQIKRTYGVHCAILPINSYDPAAPPPLEGESDSRPAEFDHIWQPFLESELNPVTGLGAKDSLAIRVFLRDMVVLSLVPWMERNVQQWNESLTAARKGLTGRLFTAGRKYFGGSASGRSTPTGMTTFSYDSSKGFYPYQTQEAQTKRLADFAFMIRDYNLAASTYDLLRKDFHNDKAWTDFAQATRMAGLSQLMGAIKSPSLVKRSDVDGFLEAGHAATQALTGQVGAVAQFDNLKDTCLYCEAYQLLQDWLRIPPAVHRQAGQDEEISSALLLEQAAIANLRIRPTLYNRKAAFYLCMAGLRYEKIGLKLLAYRCLTRAAEQYENVSAEKIATKLLDFPASPVSTWHPIVQHIRQSLGRQSYNLGKLTEASRHFLSMMSLHEACPDEDLDDQDIWDDFVNALQASGHPLNINKQPLKTGFFDSRKTSLSISHCNASATSAVTDFLDEELAINLTAQEGKVTLTKAESNVVASGVPFLVNLFAKNPSNATFHLNTFQVMAERLDGSPVLSTVLQQQSDYNLTLGPHESSVLRIELACHEQMDFRIKSIRFLLNGILNCEEVVCKRGQRLHTSKQHMLTPTYAPDLSLFVKVEDRLPNLELNLGEVPSRLLEGESVIRRLTVAFSANSLASVSILSETPSILLPLVQDSSLALYDMSFTQDISTLSLDTRLRHTAFQKYDINSRDSCLQIPVLVHGNRPGKRSLTLIFAYNLLSDKSHYHFVHRRLQIEVEPSLQLELEITPSFNSDAPYNLCLEATNMNRWRTLRIDSISSLSPLWLCSVLDESPQVPIEHGQIARVASNILAAEEEPEHDLCQPNYTPKKLERLLRGDDDLQTPMPETDILYVSAFGTSLGLKEHSPLLQNVVALSTASCLASLATQFPSISKSLLPAIFRLFGPLSLELIVFWSDVNSSQRGHLMLSGLRLGPATNVVRSVLHKAEGIAGGIYAESQRDRAALLMNIENSELGQSENPITIVQYSRDAISMSPNQRWTRSFSDFYLQNLSPITAASYSLCLHSRAEPGNVLCVSWIDQTIFTGELKPGQCMSITGKMAFSSPGLYSAGNWYLKVDSDQESWTVDGQLSTKIRVTKEPSSEEEI